MVEQVLHVCVCLAQVFLDSDLSDPRPHTCEVDNNVYIYLCFSAVSVYVVSRCSEESNNPEDVKCPALDALYIANQLQCRQIENAELTLAASQAFLASSANVSSAMSCCSVGSFLSPQCLIKQCSLLYRASHNNQRGTKQL